GVHLRLLSPDGAETLHRLEPLDDGTDRFEVCVALDELGPWSFRFEAFADEFATWAHAAEVKLRAGVDAAVVRMLGADLLRRAAAQKDRPAAERRRLSAHAEDLAAPDGPAEAALAV